MNFNPDNDIPPLTGKVILITGGTFFSTLQAFFLTLHQLRPLLIGPGGLGKGSVLALANTIQITYTSPAGTSSALKPSLPKLRRLFLAPG